MKLLITFFIFNSINLYAACSGKVDPSKMILFIDTNESDLEIETAEKSACTRGERLVVVPKNYKEYRKHIDEMNKYQRQADNCNPSEPRCVELYKKTSEAQNRLEEFKSKSPTISEALKATLKEIKEKNGKIESLVISGHDGGGHFGGSKGSFGRHELEVLIKDFEGINDIKSIMLLGCYTGVQKEMGEWKRLFPQVRLIGGYDDSAPLSTRPQGHKYLSELLSKEKSLYKMSDENKLQAFAQANLSSMFSLNSAVYLQCIDDKEKTEFYYGSKSKTKKFSPIDMKACEDKEHLKELGLRISKYSSGELEVPKDTAAGELRQIYNETRKLEHCFDPMTPQVHPQTVFNLLFYSGVKQSFANFYKKDLENAEKAISELTVESIEKSSREHIENLNKTLKDLEEKANLIKNNPKAVLENLTNELKDAKNKFKNMESSSLYSNLDDVMNGRRQPTPEESKFFNEYMKESIRVYNLEQDVLRIQSYPADSLAKALQKVDAQKANITLIETNLQSLKTKPEILKEVWIPTAENLSKKSRKELLENQYKLNGLISTQLLPAKTKKALEYTQYITTTHLQQFNNPFNWHEYKGQTVEKPRNFISYENFDSSSSFGGMYLPVAGNGIGGGGMVGGGGYGAGNQ